MLMVVGILYFIIRKSWLLMSCKRLPSLQSAQNAHEHDNLFVARDLLEHHELLPHVITRENKIMQVTVNIIIFRHTLLLEWSTYHHSGSYSVFKSRWSKNRRLQCFLHTPTIFAAYSIQCFRTCILKENIIPIIPHLGFHHGTQQSINAKQG